jgi:C4-dicarboxylate-specific signal transduction histidine kinase
MTPAELRERNQSAATEFLATGVFQSYEKEFFRKDGSRVHVLLGSATFGELRRQGIAFVVDLTERKRAEAEARETERRYRQVQLELEHANRFAAVGQLSASIAHEVNQPIAAAITNAGTALRWLDFQPPNLAKARLALDRILENGRRAGEVIAGIRALIKKEPPRQDRLVMNEAILEVIALTQGEALKSGVSMRTQLAEGLPVVEGDKVQLQQVVLNLIINALQAMTDTEEGARELLISTGYSGPEGVLVAIADSGPGLGLDSFERPFEAFYTTKSSGLGIGLPICRSIIEAHGGRLWASANVPRGAIFQFTAPIRREAT